MNESNKGLGPMHHEDPGDSDERPGEISMDCRLCAPFPCDDPDNHLGIPEEYQIPGCHCGAASDGRDCMCFEN